MTRAAIVVVTGQPGVGKSTTCARLARRRELGAHVKADDLHRMIVSGGEWPSAGTAAARHQLLVRTRSAAQVAHNLGTTGAEVFLDEVVALPEQLDILDSYIGPARWVILTASPSVVSARDASRAKHTTAAYLDVGRALGDLLAGRATFIDTDDLDVDGAVEGVEGALAKTPPFEPGARGSVHWLVEVTVASDDLGRFEALTREMLDAASGEVGTLAYERYRVDSTTFHFSERYESAAAALQHIDAFQHHFADRLSAVITRQRFHLYGAVTAQLRAALEPLGATAPQRWPA